MRAVHRRSPRLFWSTLIAFVLVVTGGAVGAYAAYGPNRGTCVRNGTGEYRDLWLTTDGKCPTGWWGPKRFGGTSGPQGPQGPKGDKGDPGDNAVVIKFVSVVLTAAAPTKTVTVTGLPGYIAGAPEASGAVQGAAPADVSVKATAIAPTTGATTRSFTASVIGPNLTGDQTATATLWVIAVKLPAAS